MTRRNLLRSGAAAAAASAAAAAADSDPTILELTTYKLRNSLKNERNLLSDFLKDGVAPALKRAGVQPAGFFSSFIAPDGPYLVALKSYPGMAGWQQAQNKLAADKKYQQALAAYSKEVAQSPIRIENQLLRAFPSMRSIEVPPRETEVARRIFELRTYESNTLMSLATKIDMFGKGEIDIFRRVGINPVFFGETIAGTHMPNLTYLVWYNDWATRDAAWAKFGADPEWGKLRSQPGFGDGEIVSNITNVLLKSLPYSDIQ